VTRSARGSSSTTTTFTLARVQALLGLSRGFIASLVEAGFVTPTRGPRNELRFTFQDLALLRTAHALHAAKIPPRRIARALARLKATLPERLPLSGLRITAIGPDVAVRARDGRWQADSGQLLLDFDVAPVAGSVALIDRGDDAADWFARAQALERSDPAGAEAAYRQTLALVPDHADAYINLGALWCEAGRYADVVALSREALAHCPRVALLHFNLGVAFDHLERLPEAVVAYERSLTLDATLADAHYNLGRLREQLGDERGALRHFSAYRRLQR
jgi:tetratricopeptide (TPR) repeat protein